MQFLADSACNDDGGCYAVQRSSKNAGPDNNNEQRMKIDKISEVLLRETNETVLCVTGVIDVVYEQNTGTNEHGPWALQNIMLKEGADKIKVKIADREPLPMSMKGKRVWIACTKNAKDTWTGIKVKEDTYKGKTSKILSVTATAEISLADPATGNMPPAEEAPREDAPPAEPANAPQAHAAPAKLAPAIKGAPAAPQAKPAPAQADFAEAQRKAHQEAVTKTRKGLASAANSYWLCLLAGQHVLGKYEQHFGEPMSEAQFQAMVSSMFIWCDRQGLVDGMPTGDMTPFLPKKPAPPAPAAANEEPLPEAE